MQIAQIQMSENGLMIEVVATTATSCCPLCAQPSSSIHCHSRRTLRDAPCAGRRVQLCLTVRTFTCRNPSCQRKVFAERLPAFVEPRARMTIRYSQQVTSIGLATSGKAGVRRAARVGMHTSRDTILRRVMRLPDSTTGSVLSSSDRRLFVPVRSLVWTHACGSGEPPSRRSAPGSTGRDLGQMNAPAPSNGGGEPGPWQ